VDLHQDDEPSGIRWFEKDVSTGKLTRTTGNPEEMEAVEMRQKLAAAKEGLKKYDANIDSEEFHNTVIGMFPPEMRETLSQALEKERLRRGEVVDDLMGSLHSDTQVAPIVKQFKKYLLLAANTPEDEKIMKELWKWYLRACRNVPGFKSSITPSAWKLLWQSQSEFISTNLNKEENLLELARNMEELGLTLAPEQQEQKIEALIVSGREEEAISMWRKEYSATNQSDKANLEQGVKLFAACGEIREAVRVLRKYEQNVSDHDPRIAQPLIQAGIQTGNDHMAFALYLKLRDQLGDKMQMTDYDVVMASFLSHDRKDLALAVFRDMMLRGSQTIEKRRKTIEEEQKLSTRLMDRIGVMQRESTTRQELNRVSLQVLTRLPVQWQNKFFFASWMKKLIGMGDVEGATKVVELMYQRGIAPDATHLNGLIGGYFRSGTREHIERGESIAWSMIRKRIEQSSEREDHPIYTHKVLDDFTQFQDEASEAHSIPLDLSRPVPNATLETFNVLGTHYMTKKQWSYLQHLYYMMKPADIKMSSFFMNEMLFMRLYTNGPGRTWADFLEYSKTTKPDIETFDCLWQAQQDSTGKPTYPTSSTMTSHEISLPPPRSLFSTMLAWLTTLPSSTSDALVLTPELYARILTTLVNSNDFPGSIVAIHAIFTHFSTPPNEDTRSILVTGLSNIYESHVGQIRTGGRNRAGTRRQVAMNANRQTAIMKIAEVIALRRQSQLARSGRDEGGLDMTDEERSRETLNLLSELMRTVLIRVLNNDRDEVERRIDVAKKEMGCVGLETGDVDARIVE